MNINLLPPDLVLERTKSGKVFLISRLSILLMLTLVIVAVLTLVFKITGNNNFQEISREVREAEDSLNSLQGKESTVFLVKQRLSLIDKLSGMDLKKRAMFNLIVSLTPADIRISDLSVDGGGNLIVSFLSSTPGSIETLISDLKSPEKSLGLVSQIDLQGLTLGRDKVYRFNLKISSK